MTTELGPICFSGHKFMPCGAMAYRHYVPHATLGDQILLSIAAACSQLAHSYRLLTSMELEQ